MMKKIIFSLVFCGILFSCKKDKAPEEGHLIGEWKLIEVLADPGDGSGTFQPVQSNKIIEFHTDGTVTSNGDLCDMSTHSNSPSSGTYSIGDTLIIPSGCSNNKITYELANNILILNYPCFEACRVKYIRS